MFRSNLSLVLLSALIAAVLVTVDAVPFVDKGVARRLAIEEITVKTTDACKRRSGLCLNQGQCPQEKLATDDVQQGLCGASTLQCCHSLPSDGIYDCEERTGICRPEAECKSGPRDEGGRCGEGHVCCVLVY